MMEKFINSPFKFLDPYGRNDAEIFFGREEEIKQLYQHIHKNRLVLVYGTSGTGKTSIVQCGLMNRMEDTDWTPFFIRRGENINDSLSKTIEQALAIAVEPEVNISNALQQGRTNVNMIKPQAATSGFREKIYATLKDINLRYLRPVYLIFDQFEELLIMGSDKERATFISIIDRILSSSDLQFCNLLFIMREEFFAGLSEFEKEIPDFCDRRLRIEPMNAKNVEDVIMRSCQKFNITLEQGNENAKQIINILTEKNTVSLPYLQIYLDQLWRTIYMNTGFKVIAVGDEYPEITVNAEIIKNFGRMNDVLNRFIKERITVIQDVLQNEFPEIPPDFVSNVLDGFVTPEGTKRPLAYLRINNGIWFTGQVAPYLQKRSGQLMIRCLNELEKNKILRTDGQTFELAHDVLAGLIDSRRTEDQRKAGFTDQQIRSRYNGFKEKTSDYLTRKELESYRPYIEQLNLGQDVLDFYNSSLATREKEEQDLLDKERSEAQETAAREKKLYDLKQRQKKMRWGWVAGGFLLISSTALYFYSEMLRKEFNRNESLVYMGYEMKKLDPVEAMNLFDPIKEKVFGDDTTKVNDKLLEFMQMQSIQGLFSMYNDTLQNPILNLSHIDMSIDGKYSVLVDDGQESRNKTHNYIVKDSSGKRVATFRNIAYAYFLNRKDILLLCTTERDYTTDEQYRSTQKRIPRYAPETQFPVNFLLYNCRTKQNERINLGGAKRFLHGTEDVAAGGTFTVYDNYRIRYTANGNLLIPFLELNDNGEFTDKVQILNPERQEIAYLPSQYTITTSHDYTKFITLYSDKSNCLDLYDENGQLIKRTEDVLFADFTEDGDMLWGLDGSVSIFQEGQERTFNAATTGYYTYVYGSSARKKLIAKTTDGTELIDMETNGRQFFAEELIATNFDKNAFITMKTSNWDGTEFFGDHLPWWGKDWNNDRYVYKDTIRRRDLNGKLIAGPFSHRDGIETIEYNKAADELLVLTKKNKLLVLDKNLRIKTGLSLTANDRYGMSPDGLILYYVRDQYYSVFKNNLDSLNVFNANKSWQLLTRKPLKMEVSKQRRKELGLRFK
ncbi:AAA family ATPase [Chitinophaga sp. SYP-B3965]|uniref:ATP-binding protein n=1 Tax=Chitinophaga sp. SYP-B3965 TaxID=2663120 RepID=UPI0012998021|nr:ATP-binding protein [Chitinophaga sp. SYP-B3965]MRG48374.1 AAA family ATPase [Chitinophaga sp. SYP-B3965]